MFFVPVAFAEEPWAPVETRAAEVRPAETGPAGGLVFVGLVGARGTLSDVTTTNPLVNGQLVGELGGSNSTTTGETVGGWAEQRVGAFFSYAPKLLDGKVALDAALEVDFAFGDSSYGIGGNTGGAVGADQVNLQTRRVAVRWDAHPRHRFVLGLQFVGDGVADPSRARPDDLFRSGGRLMVFGTEMAGLTWFGQVDRPGGEILRARAGFYTLYELAFTDPDDVTLMVADVQLAPAYAWRVGAHAWYLRDRAEGAAGLVGSGASSLLSELQGGPMLDFRASDADAYPGLSADLTWLGLDAGYNAGLDKGRFGATAGVFAQVGRLYVAELEDADSFGLLASAELRGRIAPGEGSVARAELVFATGDDPDTRDYEGIVTANSYGVAATAWGSHGCLLLFPDVGAIDRQTALAYDVSGGGAGLLGTSASVGIDPIPSRLNVTGVVGWAASGDRVLGTELGARVSGKPFVLGSLGLSGAYVLGTDDAVLPEDPWAIYLTFDWVVTG